MSYEIIKSIVVKNNEVIFRSSSNNVSPKSFEPRVAPGYTRILQERGSEALDMALMEDYENGNLQGGDNKWTRALKILRWMPEYPLYDWRGGSTEEYNKVRERRQTKEFIDLLRKALAAPIPRDKFVITQIWGGQKVYLHLRGRFGRWYTQTHKATTFRWEREAKDRILGFKNREDWAVEKL